MIVVAGRKFLLALGHTFLLGWVFQLSLTEKSIKLCCGFILWFMQFFAKKYGNV